MSELGPPKPQHENDKDFPFVQIALGLAFVFGALAFALLDPPGTLVPAFALSIPAAVLLGSALNDIAKRRHALSQPASKERELLEAIRDNGGSITAAEAAMNTTLTVGEADRILSELAAGGHLRVGSHEGTLFYSLPERRVPELGGRDPLDGRESNRA